jgi:membrane fusion protein (multidrug efflux system)
LVPGQYVSVILARTKPETRIVIPQAAVQENQAGPFVLIVNGEGRVETRPVRTAERVDAGVVVLEGLTEGETLIVEGIQKVRPGAEVQTALRTPAQDSMPEQDTTPAQDATSEQDATPAQDSQVEP